MSRNQFFNILNCIAMRSNYKLQPFDYEFFDNELGHDYGKYIEALKSFYKQNYSRPRLPSPIELKEAVDGKQPSIGNIVTVMVASYLDLIAHEGSNAVIKEKMGDDFMRISNSLVRIEQLRLLDNFQINQFKSDLKKILLEKSEKEVKSFPIFNSVSNNEKMYLV